MTYRTAEALLGEFTRSIGQGQVSLESKRAVPVGTRFLFELRALKVAEPVEVQGEVMQVTARGEGYVLSIRYDPGPNRHGVDAVLRHLFAAQKAERIRKHARVPLVFRATDGGTPATRFQIRDLSHGGLGATVEGAALPRAIKVGQAFLLELWMPPVTLALHGEVAWVLEPPETRSRWTDPAFGGRFGKLRPDEAERLDKVLALRGLPKPPWRARLSFGLDAVERMPEPGPGKVE